MSSFDVKVGKGDRAKGGLKAPPKRKPIHPGLQRIASGILCLRCGTFLEWSGFVRMLVSSCDCGLWFKDEKQFIRWIRWSSAPFWPGPNAQDLFSPMK